jgi:hypothetical protein
MKKIFTFFLASLAVGMANAQTTITTSANANQTVATNSDIKAVIPVEEMLTMKEMEYDFGKIPQGKPVTHIFEVFNRSKDTLRISNVQASCGCTTPQWNKDEPVPGGKNTKITVGYNAAAEGPFTKQITITYNAAQVKVITIKGEVWKTPAASAPENKSINDLKN